MPTSIFSIYSGETLFASFPVNSDKSRQTVFNAGIPNLEIELIDSDPRFVPTLRTLLQAAGDMEWVFWSNSDRIPYAAASVETLSSLAETLCAEKVVPGNVGAIRLTRWRDTNSPYDTAVDFADLAFEVRPFSEFGLWHHQFMRRNFLEALLSGLSKNDSLRDFHEHCKMLISRSQSLAWLLQREAFLSLRSRC